MSRPPDARSISAAGRLAFVFGMVVVFWSLIEAIVRLTPLAVAPLRTGMKPLVWLLYLGFVGFNAYAEGYRGFQCAFSPRLAARAVLLLRAPTTLRLALAPLFLMALYDAPRRRLFINWSLVLGIVGLVLLLRVVPQPWRGVVDAGVVAGLAWGTLATLVIVVRVLRGTAPCVDAELAREQRVPAQRVPHSQPFNA